MLTLSVENVCDGVILHCTGRIVRGSETTLLCTALGRGDRDVLLDLAGVEAIDAAGLGALLSLQAAGIYLRLRNLTKPVRELLRISHLDSILEIQDSASSEELICATA